MVDKPSIRQYECNFNGNVSGNFKWMRQAHSAKQTLIGTDSLSDPLPHQEAPPASHLEGHTVFIPVDVQLKVKPVDRR